MINSILKLTSEQMTQDVRGISTEHGIAFTPLQFEGVVKSRAAMLAAVVDNNSKPTRPELKDIVSKIMLSVTGVEWMIIDGNVDDVTEKGAALDYIQVMDSAPFMVKAKLDSVSEINSKYVNALYAEILAIQSSAYRYLQGEITLGELSSKYEDLYLAFERCTGRDISLWTELYKAVTINTDSARKELSNIY